MSLLDLTQDSGRSKFLVIGGSDCGKTTMIDYYCNPEQKPNRVKQTVGCDVHIKELPSSVDGTNAEDFVEFWDISGDSNYQNHVNIYTKAQEKGLEGFKGIIFFFDMNNIKTLSNMNKYLKELVPQKKGGNKAVYQPVQEQLAKIPILMVGNKSDLIEECDRENKCQKIKGQLDLIFDYDPSVKYTFTSKYSTFETFDNLQKFVDDCISEKHDDLYLFDASNGLCTNDKYKYFSKKTLDLVENDLRRVQRFISTKSSHLYALTAGVMLTLTFNSAIMC